MAMAPADRHGCPACPHPVMGVIISGNPQVLINGLPVACEGDIGTHAACCGPNNFVIRDGDDFVRINGKRVAKIGSSTIHCGGMGQIVSAGPAGRSSDALMALSDDVSLTREGKKIPNNSSPKTGTEIKTGPKGLLMMNPDRHTVVMLWPYSSAVVKDASGKDLIIEMREGTVSVNGTSDAENRNLVFQTLKETIERKGTRFLFTHSKETSRLLVYEGEVRVRLKDNNQEVTVPAGKVYINDFKNPWRLEDTTQFQAASLLEKLPKDSASWQLPRETSEASGTEQQKDFLSLLKKYWYFAAGLALLLLLLAMSRRRRK